MSATTSKTFPFYGTVWNNVPAVYVIMNSRSQIIYVGSTDDLARRMREHQNDSTHCMHRYAPALVWAEVVQVETTRLARERELIARYSPPCNAR